MMIRPPSDALSFAREIGTAAFGDAWIPRMALEFGCEGSEASIAEAVGGYVNNPDELDRKALVILDAAASRIADVRDAVAGSLEDRRLQRVRRDREQKRSSLEELRAYVRENEPPMVADFLEDLLTDEPPKGA